MIKNAAVRAFATFATAAALIGGSAAAASAAVPRPAPEPTVTLDPRPFPYPTPYPTLHPHRPPVLYDVDADTRRRCDVLTFSFRGEAPDDVSVQWVRTLRESPSRRLVRLPGRAFLQVTFEDARALRSLRGTRHVDLDVVRAHRLLGDYDGEVTVGVGLRQRAPFWVRTHDDQVVLTVCPRWRGPVWGPFPRPLNED